MVTGTTERQTGMLQIVSRLFAGRERMLLTGVFALGCLTAVFETLAVASIVPFLSFVLDPAAMDRYPTLGTAARWLGVTTPRGTLLLLGAVTVGLVTIGNVLSALFLWTQQRFAARTETRLASALFAGYLQQPFAFHTRRDAPSLMKVVLNDVSLVMMQVVTPAMIGLSRGLMALGVVTLLFLKDPTAAAIVIVVLGAAYGLVYRAVRKSQQALGVVHTASTLERQRVSQEGLGGVKELKVLGREGTAIERFETATGLAARARANNATVAQLPRYVLEAVAFGGILLVTLAILAKGNASSQQLVPSLALYAFAGYRLLPALQTLFSAAITVRFSYPMLVELYRDYEQVVSVRKRSLPPSEEPVVTFADAIRLEHVKFAYAESESPSLVDVSLVIRPNESIGLVGRTGAGKTTLADLILGLHEPTGGQFTVDGVPITSGTRRAWQRRVGYVPQHVFLANASVAENIAFGLAAFDIDHAAVRRAAERAQADEFIRALPEGFATTVGERGVKLSGGQRQRIGIARALYHEPEVLVLDEATSALDGLTEDAVMHAVRALSGTRTIILIAHRLRTVEACNRIVMLDHGRVVADGPYHQLLDTSAHFRRLVGRVRAEANVPSA
jgi:ABC-type multidrug transport system fused ATPase/permease subunit